MKLFPGKTYSRFVVREYLKVFVICIVFIVGLSFIVRTLQKTHALKAFTFAQIVMFRLIDTPEIISREALLASCMFASVYTMGILTRNNEILALRSCGVSVYRIISPLIVLGVIIAGGSLLFEDFVVVKSIELRDRFGARLRGEDVYSYLSDRRNIVVFGENGLLFKIDHYEARAKKMTGVIVIQKNASGGIRYQVEAQKARWEDGKWVFSNGVRRVFADDGRIREEERFSVLPTDIRDNPDHFGRERRRIENMTLKAGYNYVHAVKRMGLDYEKLMTKFHRKIANSVTLLIVILIGLSLGSLPFKNALVISFGMTLITVLAFFFIIEIGETFGSTGKIPPVLGGWLGNIVFSIVAVFLLRRVRV
jgi:lipopolysaccharide export system permease protein